MILTSHAVFGAAVASLVPNHPVEAFSLAFLSHFILDAIPHRDYDLHSIDAGSEEKKPIIDIIINKYRFIRDVCLVSFDALLGICLSFMFFFDPIYPWIFLIGAVSSLIPDFLTFLYLIIKHKPLVLFTNFHLGLIHSKSILKLSQPVGVVLQFCTVALLIFILFSLRSFF